MKLALATSVVYIASSLVIPAFANTVEKPVERPVLQPLDLTQITTVEQAEQAYNERIKIYAEDKKLNHKEITDLGDILAKKNHLLYSQRENLEREIDKLKWYGSSTTGLHTEIGILEDKLLELESKKVYVSPEFEKVKKDLDEQVLCYYPSLISKEKNVTYSASDSVEQELNPILKDLIFRADKVLQMYYNDTTLEFLTRKKIYAIKDILTLYEELYKKRNDVCFNDEEVSHEQQKLKDKIQALQTKIGQLKIKDEQENKVREQRVSDLRMDIVENIIPQIRVSERESRPFRRYSSQKEGIDNFIERYGNLNKYMSFSFYSVADGFLGDLDLGNKRNNFRSENKRVVSELEELFKSKGYDVKVASLKNPAHTMFPWPWWVNFIFGIAFPIGRNIITAKFIRREVDEFDVIEGIGEMFLCSFFFDACFPLFYPLRLFGMPFLLEPLRAATGGRNLK